MTATLHTPAPAPPTRRRTALDAEGASGHRPLVLRMAEPDQQTEIERLWAEPHTLVTDTLWRQLRDLVKVRCPEETLSGAELDARALAHLGDREIDAYGTWTYFPWSRRLVHLLDEEEFVELRTDRNHHKITVEEQRSLASRKIGVVGLSAGGAVALTLALERSCGELRLADFDELDLSNLNRLRCGVHEIGVNKAFLAARSIAEIDPYLEVTCFPEGYTSEMAAEFFTDLDLVVEECDSVDAKVTIRLEARRRRIPVLMATSDSGSTDVERFDLEPERPLFHGWLSGVDPDELLGLSTTEKVPYILRIAQLASLSTRAKASLVEIGQTLGTWPQLGSEVSMGGAVIAELSRRLLLGEPVPSGRSYVGSQTEPPAGVPSASVPAAAAAPSPSPSTDDALAGSDAEPDLAPELRSMIEAAILAPSPGNNQPWRFEVGRGTIDVTLVPGRAYSLHDHEGRAAVVALGAAIENAVLAAHAAGHRVAVVDQSEGWRSVRATLILDPPSGDESRDHDHLAASITRRATSRARTTRTTLDPTVIQQLRGAAESVHGCRATIVEEPTAIDRLADLLGGAERCRVLSPSLHQELIGEFRFTAEEVASTTDGISIPELEFEPKHLPLVDMLRDRPTIDLLRSWGLGRNLGEPTRLVCTDASAFVFLTMPTDCVDDYLAGGRALERMWLAATGLGIAVQPVTSLNYLGNRVRKAPGTLEPDIEAELGRLHRAFRELVAPPVGAAEIVLLRLATGPMPVVRSRRHRLEACTTVTS